MIVRTGMFICMVLAALLMIAGCSGSFDAETGNYSYKDFSLRLPVGWGKTKTTPGALITVGNPEELHQIDVIVHDIPENVSFDRFVNNITSNYRRVARSNGSGQMTLGGIEGHWSDWKMSIGNYQYRTLVYAVMKDGKVYSVICIASEEMFPSYEGTFDNVAASITFD